jgi:hypothetical protein
MIFDFQRENKTNPPIRKIKWYEWLVFTDERAI